MAEFLIVMGAEENSKGNKETDERDCRTDSKTIREEYYNMDHRYRGMAMIFSHDHFQSNLDPRRGTIKDAEDLYKSLTNVGFNVHVFSNLKYSEIIEHIQRASRMDHTDNDCILIVVLTHGDPGILHAYDTHYESEKLWRHFTEQNCPSLAGKPKLFIFQACQGAQYDNGITLTRLHVPPSNWSKPVIPDDIGGWFEPHKNPIEPDFLVVRSTVPGYFSWRSIYYGSWLIQTLCEELYYSAYDTDILKLLTTVCHKVALNFQSCTNNLETSGMKQVPCISSMLTRRLVLTKKPYTSPTDMLSLFKHFEKC